MNEFEFSSLPDNIIVSNINGFDKSCSFMLSDDALKAIQNGSLKIKIQKNGNISPISDINMSISAISGDITIVLHRSNVSIHFGEKVRGRYHLGMFENTKVTIGDKTTSNGVHIVCMNSEFICGSDCMFSDGILIQTSDQHGLVDLNIGQITNEKFRSVILENHVWLGRQCALTPSARIGSGSVIALKSIVTKMIPSNSVAAGNPAKVVKSNYSWSRHVNRLDDYSREYVHSYHTQFEV